MSSSSYRCTTAVWRTMACWFRFSLRYFVCFVCVFFTLTYHRFGYFCGWFFCIFYLNCLFWIYSSAVAACWGKLPACQIIIIILQKASTDWNFSLSSHENLAPLGRAKLYLRLHFEVQFLYADRCAVWVNFSGVLLKKYRWVYARNEAPRSGVLG